MNIGNAIRTLRKSQGIKQNELAAMAGITPGYLSMIETNAKQNISGEILECMAAALNTSPAAIIFNAIEPEDIKPEARAVWQILELSIKNMIQ
jgi:transcriptional regulator with XRE-family HTH domain